MSRNYILHHKHIGQTGRVSSTTNPSLTLLSFRVILAAMTSYTRDQARTEIENLVAQFRENEATLLNAEEANIEMVLHVEQMLDLHKRRHAAKTETDKKLYQQQIDATDKQIDALVYELYGLTDEEIKIVEGQ
jgi:hypothetical protein